MIDQKRQAAAVIAMKGRKPMTGLIMEVGKTLSKMFRLLFIAGLTASASATEISYYHNDHLGTPQVLTDANQNIVWQAGYDPFGKATVTTETVTNNVRFPGQYFDAETGLHYNYFRTYDPSIGRYVTSDPIGLDGGMSTYGYVGGNPLNRIDPTGEIAPILWWLVVGSGVIWTGIDVADSIDEFNSNTTVTNNINSAINSCLTCPENLVDRSKCQDLQNQKFNEISKMPKSGSDFMDALESIKNIPDIPFPSRK